MSATSQRTVAAALWMTGAIGSFSAMAVAGRAVSAEHSTFEIMMYRSFIGLAIVLAVGGAVGTLREIKTDRLGLHALRNIGHFTGQNLWFFALTLIPLAQLFALEFTSPLWVAVLSALFLGERLTRLRVTTLGVGFIGVLIVARPEASGAVYGLLAAATSAIGFAIAIVTTKRLTQDQSITCILFWLTAMQAILGVIACSLTAPIALPSATTLPWLVVIGIAGLLAHFCLTTALSLAPATVVIPIDFLRLPLIAVVGALFYQEALAWPVFFGAALIFGANYVNVLAERQRYVRP